MNVLSLTAIAICHDMRTIERKTMNRVSPKPMTIKEIAREAGVSTQTVSRVLNDRPDVAKETRLKVQHVIALYNYEPSAVARSLIRQRSFTLGLVVSHLNFYGPSAMLVELDQQAVKQGYTLLPQFIHDAQAADAQSLKRLIAQQVDGVLWGMPSISDESKSAVSFSSFSVPLVSVGDPVHGARQPVVIDEQAGARLATQHLIEQGYRKIGLISGPPDWSATIKRQNGWLEVMRAAEMEVDMRHIVQGDWTAASGERGLYQLVEQCPDLDAVFVCNDQMALGALLAAQRLGRAVPEALGLVGFDDFPESAYFWPPLTTIRQPWAEKCALTVRELIRLIEEKLENGVSTTTETLLLPPELLVRESSRRV